MSEGVTLYWISGSPPSWRVMMALAVKGIAYTSVRLDVSRKEHKAPEYLAINPRGQVPTLVHGDITVRESIAILAYLDAAYPTVPLFGETPARMGAIWQAVMEIDSALRPPAGQIARGLFRGNADPHSDDLQGTADEVAAEMMRIDENLRDGRPWLCGTEITAADIVLYPTLAWLFRALERTRSRDFPALRAEHLGLDSWHARIEAQEWFETTYPPHWR